MSAPLKSKDKQKLRAKLLNQCAWSGATQDLTTDHITPRCFGGTNEQHNLQTLCAPCSSISVLFRATTCFNRGSGA